MNSHNNKHDNKHESSTHDAYCVCTQSNGLFIPNRHLSHIVAASMLGLFFVFLAGFFCGKQHEIKHFLYSVDEDSFSDQISSALYGVSLEDLADMEATENGAADSGSGDGDAQDTSMSGGDDGSGSAPDNAADSDSAPDESSESDAQEGEGNESDAGSDSSAQLATRAQQQAISGSVTTQGATRGSSSAATTIAVRDNSDVRDSSQKRYYAQLIGFGTSQAADSFARRLTKQGFSVKVEQCKSRTAKGKIITWYQVVTNPYSDVQKLQEVIDIVAYKEKLKGVRVKTC